MPRAVACLLLPLALVACAPARDDAVVRQVIVNAHVARDAVSHLTMRYRETLESAGSLHGSPGPGWEGIAGFRESAEGLAARQFLSGYGKPVSVDPAFPRAREIEELSRATAELVALALEPRGTWESFVQEKDAVRSRVDKALSALETGAKSHILVQARTETEEKGMAYTRAIAAAKAADQEKRKGAESAPQGASKP